MKPSCLYKHISKEQAQKAMNNINKALLFRHEGSPEGFLRAVLRARPATKKADLVQMIVSI